MDVASVLAASVSRAERRHHFRLNFAAFPRFGAAKFIKKLVTKCASADPSDFIRARENLTSHLTPHTSCRAPVDFNLEAITPQNCQSVAGIWNLRQTFALCVSG
jgi:hypothetical protein